MVAVRTRNCVSLRKAQHRPLRYRNPRPTSQLETRFPYFSMIKENWGRPFFLERKIEHLPVMQAAIVREPLLDLHPRNGPGLAPFRTLKKKNPVYASHLSHRNFAASVLQCRRSRSTLTQPRLCMLCNIRTASAAHDEFWPWRRARKRDSAERKAIFFLGGGGRGGGRIQANQCVRPTRNKEATRKVHPDDFQVSTITMGNTHAVFVW